MLFRQMLMSGATRLLAPEDDDGFEYEDPADEADQVDEPEVEDEDPADEPDEPEDLIEDEAPAAAPAPSRKPFSQRVEEVASRKAAEIVAQQLEAWRAQQAQAARPPAETPQQLEARLAQMEPWERAEVRSQMVAENVQAQLAQMRWESQEAADKTSFDALCAREPAAAKLKDAVEARLATMRATGSTVNREVLYTHMLGERARAGATRATNRSAKTAEQNRARQTTRPSQGRSDNAASDNRGGNLSAIEKRLNGVNI